MSLANSLGRSPTSRLLTTTCFALSATIVRALSTTQVVVPQYTSCASPKFDLFSERLIGEWQWKQDGSTKVESVEEVMRSCGGAVQGIREVPSLSFFNQEEGYYLNRANDGFVFFDEDGSYTCGPVKDSDDETPWLSSLSCGKTRILLRKDAVTMDACKQLQVCRKSYGDPIEISKDASVERLPENIVWQKIVRCRMPSPSMPWMANRLKWEKCILLEESGDVNEKSNEAAGNVQTWAFRIEAEEEPVIKSILEDSSASSIVWSAGALCENTGVAKTILRQYNKANGSLQSVVWVDGRVQS